MSNKNYNKPKTSQIAKMFRDMQEDIFNIFHKEKALLSKVNKINSEQFTASVAGNIHYATHGFGPYPQQIDPEVKEYQDQDDKEFEDYVDTVNKANSNKDDKDVSKNKKPAVLIKTPQNVKHSDKDSFYKIMVKDEELQKTLTMPGIYVVELSKLKRHPLRKLKPEKFKPGMKRFILHNSNSEQLESFSKINYNKEFTNLEDIVLNYNLIKGADEMNEEDFEFDNIDKAVEYIKSEDISLRRAFNEVYMLIVNNTIEDKSELEELVDAALNRFLLQYDLDVSKIINNKKNLQRYDKIELFLAIYHGLVKKHDFFKALFLIFFTAITSNGDLIKKIQYIVPQNIANFVKPPQDVYQHLGLTPDGKQLNMFTKQGFEVQIAILNYLIRIFMQVEPDVLIRLFKLNVSYFYDFTLDFIENLDDNEYLFSLTGAHVKMLSKILLCNESNYTKLMMFMFNSILKFDTTIMFESFSVIEETMKSIGKRLNLIQG